MGQTIRTVLSRGNKPNRFAVGFWWLNLPKLGRLFMRYGLVIMPPQHRGRRMPHQVVESIYIIVSLGGLGPRARYVRAEIPLTTME